METTIEADTRIDVPVEVSNLSHANNQFEVEAECLIVDSPTKYLFAGSALGQIKFNKKIIQDALKKQKSGARKVHKNWCDLENKYVEPLDHAEEVLKEKCVTYYDQVKKAEAESDSNAPSIIPTNAGITPKTTWKAEVTDASLVPREFLVVDYKKLADMAVELKGAIEIEGVRFYPKTSMING